ncbi:MAG: PadR family transcriptional regulator [Propionibacteriaceae bacterium]|nr:PadR family transcriptional regulator [Propionibacteriaceae bacterium]
MSKFDDTSFDDGRPFRGGRDRRRGPMPGRDDHEWIREAHRAKLREAGRLLGDVRMRGGGFDPREFGMGGHRARRGQLRESILALLAEQPRNGYQLMGAVAEKTAGAWTPSPGALYPALAQLVDEGLIAEQPSDAGKVYALTDAGRAEAAKLTEPWADAMGRGPAGHEQRHALWEEFRRLGATIRLASDTATPDQLDEMADGLANQRKAILRTLGSTD